MRCSCVLSLDLKKDWSDHALWWEQKQHWLIRTGWTLDKCGVHADARLVFTPQHKPLRLGLPNGATLKMRACFSSPVFRTVVGICRVLSKWRIKLGSSISNLLLSFRLPFPKWTLLSDLRHPEELSLLRPVEQKKKKKDKDSSEELYDLTDVPLTAGAQNNTLKKILLHYCSKVWSQKDVLMLLYPQCFLLKIQWKQ